MNGHANRRMRASGWPAGDALVAAVGFELLPDGAGSDMYEVSGSGGCCGGRSQRTLFPALLALASIAIRCLGRTSDASSHKSLTDDRGREQ